MPTLGRMTRFLCSPGIRAGIGANVPVLEVTAPNQDPTEFTKNYQLSGQTLNSSGSALPFCTVDLFDSATDIKIATTVSDSSANYSFTLGYDSLYYYEVAYLASAPDVAGTTVNTLRPVAI